MSKASGDQGEPPGARASKTRLLGIVIALALSYAVVRYHLIKGVPWIHLPLYVLNKALSLAAILLVSMSYLIGRVIRRYNHDRELRAEMAKFCGLSGLALAIVHAVFSLCLLSKEYYPAFFGNDDKLNLAGELGLCGGALGIGALLFPASSTQPAMRRALGNGRWKRHQRFGYLAISLLLMHLVAFGLKGWLEPGTWPGGLPPITLVGAVPPTLALLARLGRNPLS